MGCGNNTLFWLDRWIDNRRLCDRFPRLYHLDRRKEANVAEMGIWVDDRWSWVWDWVREPRGRGCSELEDLVGILSTITLSHDCRDHWRWALSKDGKFAVKDLADWWMRYGFKRINRVTEPCGINLLQRRLTYLYGVF